MINRANPSSVNFTSLTASDCCSTMVAQPQPQPQPYKLAYILMNVTCVTNAHNTTYQIHNKDENKKAKKNGKHDNNNKNMNNDNCPKS